MASACRYQICSLQPQMQNTVIIGIIIQSQNSKIIDPSRARYNVGSRAVWNFTLRDSINDFINVSVWGTVDYINNLLTTFGIGSVVEIINAKILERKKNDPSEIYVPAVTSPLTLSLNQRSSLIQMYDSHAASRYHILLQIPTKNPAGICNLEYILENIEVLTNQYVDLIVAVTFVSQTREIITRLGELMKIREFEIGDTSTNKTVSLTLWDREWIKLADKWESRQTILFLADAQIYFNERLKSSTLAIVRRTLITENPDIDEAKEIRFSFQTKPDLGSSSSFAIPNPNSITNKMTIREITNKLNQTALTSADNKLQLLVIVTATVDDMNLESDDLPVIGVRCIKCKRPVGTLKDSCMNLECPFGTGIKSPMNEISADILINLKDDTGYLVGCHFRNSAVERVLGCTVQELQEMTREQRIEIKEKYYKKLCIVHLQILCPTLTLRKTIYNILDINIIDCNEHENEYLTYNELNTNYE